MAAGDDSTRVEISGGGAPGAAPDPADAQEALRRDLEALETKLQTADGISGLADWLGEVEAVIGAIPDRDLDGTRGEIREVIDKLLQINAEVQNLVRLKKLLA